MCGLPVRLKIQLPIRSLGWVNSYLFPEDKAVVDPGMLSGKSILDLARGLAAHGLRLGSVERVVLTHFHVDHSTAASLLWLEGSPTIYIGIRDREVLELGVEGFVERAVRLFVESGMPSNEAESVIRSHPAIRLAYAYEVLRDADVRVLREGDLVRLGGSVYRVIEVPGHTPGSILLFDGRSGVLLTGDTLLPGITPHVTLHGWRDDPLGDYLRSLDRIVGLGARVALPGHRDPIEDPAGRAREIIRHHKERLMDVAGILERSGPMPGYEIAKRVKWRTRYKSWEEYPLPERFFAMAEPLAHLRRLEVAGVVERFHRNGIVYWRLAQ